MVEKNVEAGDVVKRVDLVGSDDLRLGCNRRIEPPQLLADRIHQGGCGAGPVAGLAVWAAFPLIAERAWEDLDGPVVRVATPDVPIPFSPPLEQAVLPQVDDVREACRELLAY